VAKCSRQMTRATQGTQGQAALQLAVFKYNALLFAPRIVFQILLMVALIMQRPRCSSVTVMGPIPHDSAPNPLAMFLVAIW
jgi:hypothetical protein